MSAAEQNLRQKAAQARRENPDLIPGEKLVRRVGEQRAAKRREAEATHAETRRLLAEGEAMLRKLRGDGSSSS